MAVIGNITIGMLVDNSKLKKGFDNSRGVVKSAGSNLNSMLVGAFAGFTATAAVREIGSVIMAASALNEQISGVGQVFKGSADVVTAAAQRMADQFGIVKTEYLKGATGLGSLGKASGQTDAEAAGLAVTMTDLAADLSSFRDVPFEEALLAIRSGLAGESEPLRKFGVLLSENAVNAEAARLGIARMGSTLTEAQKVQARSSLITKGLTDASGDLARTSDSVGNRMRALSGRIENLKADAGGAFDSISRAVLGGLDTAIQGMTANIGGNQEAIKAWADEAARSGGVVNEFIVGVGKIGGAFTAVAHVVNAVWSGLMYNLHATIAEITGDLAATFSIVDRALEAGGFQPTGIGASLTDQSAAFSAAAEQDKAAFMTLFDELPGGEVEGFFNNMAQGASAAAGATSAAAKEMVTLSDAQLKVSASVANLTEHLREQVGTFGMSGDEAAIYKLKLQGATDAELAEAMSLTQVAKSQDHFKDLQSDAKSLIEAGMTPMERYQQELNRIDELKANGLISDEQGFDAANRARKEFGGGDMQTHGAGLEMGSAEARSAILKFQNGREGEPMREVAVTARAQLAEAKVQTVSLKDMAEKFGDFVGGKAIDILGAF